MRYFVGVGAQKSGTTWLHDQLLLHPQIGLPERKEVHYFDSVCPTRDGKSYLSFFFRDIRKSLRIGDTRQVEHLLDVLEVISTGDQAYREYLGGKASSETRIVGEITPGYAVLDVAGFERIRDVLQDPRIVYVMRDPLARYWSAIRMSFRSGSDAEVFESAIEKPAVWARSDYRSTVEALDAVFSDVLYLFYEDLFNEETLGRVARFLGIDERWPWRVDQTSRVGTPRDMPDVPDAVRGRLDGIYEFVRERFGDAVPDSWVS